MTGSPLECVSLKRCFFYGTVAQLVDRENVTFSLPQAQFSLLSYNNNFDLP